MTVNRDRISGRPSRTALVLAIAFPLAMIASAASAQLDDLDDITDPILDPSTSPSPEPLPTTLPDPDDDPVTKTIKKVTGETDGGGGAVPQGGDDGGDDGEDGGESGESSKKSTKKRTDRETTSGGGAGKDDGPGEDDGGATDDADATMTDATAAPSGNAGEDDSYQALAARGTVAAAQRAVELAGPLAPPIVLAALALLAVLMLSRGDTSRLIKVEPSRFPERKYRL